MKITGEDLFFLIQVLKDSLSVEMGSRYVFNNAHDIRQKFHDQFIQSILRHQEFEVQGIDYSKLNEIT